MILSMFVAGRPITQGSLRPVPGVGRMKGKTVLRPDTKGGTLHAWREAIAWSARAAMQTQPVTTPVAIALQFFIQPKQRADLDKLTRAVLDALSTIVFRDDVQVEFLSATKSDRHAIAGVQIDAWEIR